jgi:hypothetical protein
MIGTVITTRVESALGVKVELIEIFEWSGFEEYARLVLGRLSDDKGA